MFSTMWVRFNSLPPADKPQQNRNKTVQEMSQRNWFFLFSVHALDLIFSSIKHGTILVLKVVEIFWIITKAFQICRFFLISEQAPVLGAEFPVIYKKNCALRAQFFLARAAVRARAGPANAHLLIARWKKKFRRKIAKSKTVGGERVISVTCLEERASCNVYLRLMLNVAWTRGERA
jgi:hypothetical protein